MEGVVQALLERKSLDWQVQAEAKRHHKLIVSMDRKINLQQFYRLQSSQNFTWLLPSALEELLAFPCWCKDEQGFTEEVKEPGQLWLRSVGFSNPCTIDHSSSSVSDHHGWDMFVNLILEWSCVLSHHGFCIFAQHRGEY